DNAVKYTTRGGRIEIEAVPDRGDVVIRVRDTGVGIAARDLPRIWDRLYRGDQSRATRGLGLGLSLVRASVEAQGGTVSVESTPGKGSTFTLPLPPAALFVRVRRLPVAGSRMAVCSLHVCNPRVRLLKAPPTSQKKRATGNRPPATEKPFSDAGCRSRTPA